MNEACSLYEMKKMNVSTAIWICTTDFSSFFLRKENSIAPHFNRVQYNCGPLVQSCSPREISSVGKRGLSDFNHYSPVVKDMHADDHHRELHGMLVLLFLFHTFSRTC